LKATAGAGIIRAMSYGNISTRFAVPADLDFVRQDRHLPPEVVRRKIEGREVVVAELDGGPVGYLRLEYLWSKVPYVELIRVAPEYRRRGVGRALLTSVEGFLRERGHAALYSSSQADEAEPQAWHRRVGFEECGIIAGINEGGVGEVFFRKRL
jgi:ribosomal protein S18 acetylase RimI-like enzyme